MESTLKVLGIALTGAFKNTLKVENLERDWKALVKSMDNSFRQTGPLGVEELWEIKKGMIKTVENSIQPEELIKEARLEGFTVEIIEDAKKELLRYIENNFH